MDRNDSSNPGMVERQMDDSTGERMTDREDMVGREGMAGVGSGATGNETERGERQAQTTPDRDDGSYGNDSGFAAAGTESERTAPGRTENGGLTQDRDVSGTTNSAADGSSRDF